MIMIHTFYRSDKEFKAHDLAQCCSCSLFLFNKFAYRLLDTQQ